ncbi:MAG: hypothetical protein WBX11_07610 [Thiobacillaceae bacterium]
MSKATWLLTGLLAASISSNASYAVVECKITTERCITECMNIDSALDASRCYSREMAQADKALNAQYQRLTALAKNYDSELANTLFELGKDMAHAQGAKL